MEFPALAPAHDEQIAVAQGQLWSAYGQLGELRRQCVNLARIRYDFGAGADGYEKVDRVLPPEALAPLRATCCPLEATAMLRAAQIIVAFYEDVAPELTRQYGLPYVQIWRG